MFSKLYNVIDPKKLEGTKTKHSTLLEYAKLGADFLRKYGKDSEGNVIC